MGGGGTPNTSERSLDTSAGGLSAAHFAHDFSRVRVQADRTLSSTTGARSTPDVTSVLETAPVIQRQVGSFAPEGDAPTRADVPVPLQREPGPNCSRHGDELPLANRAFRGERGFAYVPEGGHPGPGGLLVRRDSVSIRISARWEEQIADPTQRPREHRRRSPDQPQYYLSFNGWMDDCESGAGRQASSVRSGNLAIGTEHTVALSSLRPGRYGLQINPSTAAPEPNRVLVGNVEVS
jgi:hypothetical protein